jgi:hypothetical protein
MKLEHIKGPKLTKSDIDGLEHSDFQLVKLEEESGEQTLTILVPSTGTVLKLTV